MGETLRLSGYREPLGLWIRSAARPPAHPELSLRDIEFSSRGDRVAGSVARPANGAGPLPLVLFQPDGTLAAHTAVATVGAIWAGSGAAVASVDLPLHGSRADQKLLDLLPGPGERAPAWRDALAHEFTRQAVIDLERTLDALLAVEWIDADRVAFVGFGLGARIGSAFCALDARVRAAVLAPHPGGPETPGADPEAWAPHIAPRPLLWIGASVPPSPDDGERIPLEVPPDELPRAAAPAIDDFLARTFRRE